MENPKDFEIFLATAPGLEHLLAQEAGEKGFKNVAATAGGVTLTGGWRDVWRANLEIRGASRVLARIGSFPAVHLAQLDKRARKIAWREVLRPDLPVRIEATCQKSRIYHTGAAAERIERAVREEIGVPVSPDAGITIHVRIADDICTLSVDTSGELLHKRGHKEEVNAAPMRENLAAMFLMACGYNGKEPVVDPMCGSGTFVIEAAEIAAGLKPGRSRSFSFEKLASFDQKAWDQMRFPAKPAQSTLQFHGSDRDPGAIRISRANAERADVAAVTQFSVIAVKELTAPEGPKGLVIVNPPYGDRLSDKSRLSGVYRTLGDVLKTRFRGWRTGLITSDPALARSTGLPFLPSGAPVVHGGLRVKLYQTKALP